MYNTKKLQEENKKLNRELGLYAGLCVWDQLLAEEFLELYETENCMECDPDYFCDTPIETNPQDNLDQFVNEFLKFQKKQIETGKPCFESPILFRFEEDHVWFFTYES